MAFDRRLIDYIPPFMQGYGELKSIMDTEQVEVDYLWLKTDDVFADQFILDATEHGVRRWESMLGISPKDTDTLDERKFRILTKMNQELPYTLRKLEQALTNLCGNNMFSIEVNPADYHVEIELGLVNQNNYQEVVDVLRKMIPANMTQWVQIKFNNHAVLSNFTHGGGNGLSVTSLYGKTVQNGAPSPTAPIALESVGDDGSVDVNVCGKNLLPITATSKKDTGVTFTVNTDGSITANGTATAGLWFALNRTVVLPNGNYILSGCSGGAGDTYSLYVDVDGNNTFCLTNEVNFTIADPVSVKVVILVKEGKTISETFYPMIRKATVTDATYEPYKGPQTLAIPTPNGLPGIPVSSGGNYTDDSGQQWICAEIDLARGKRVQRVVPTELTGKEYGWSLTSNGNCVYWDYEADYSDLNTTLYTGGYCNQYPNVFARPANSYEYCHAWYGAKGGVRRHMFKDSRYTTVAEWKAHLAELYAAGTPIVVLSVPVTPIETDLTVEELADFTALRINDPNATVYSAEGAGVKLDYVTTTGLSAYTHEQLRSEVFTDA